MKKTLSLVLAAVLAFGTAVSAFAVIAPANARPTNPTTGATQTDLYKWNSTSGKFTITTDTAVTYGSTIGFLITDGTTPAGAANIATKSDHVKNLKPYVTYSIPNSSTLVEKVAVEYKKYAVGGTDKYGYFVTMKTKANTTAASADLYGEMRLGTSKTNAEDAARAMAPFNITLENNLEAPTSSYVANEVKNNWTLDFDQQNDVEIDFNGLASYIVDATGQSKLNCGFSTKFNSEFSAKYPAANLEFLTFGAKPSFNRIGELTIYSEDGKYLYEITADGFKEPKYTYDEDYEAFVLKTRTLGSYVISDVELEPEVVEETPAPSVPGQNPPTGGTSGDVDNGGKANPNTGR